MDIPIIFEDDDVLVINKPAGLIVHSDGRTEEPSVAEWAVAKYPDMQDVGESLTLHPHDPSALSAQRSTLIIARPGIVHRLDRTTSGVMILAKTKEAHAFLKEQFQERGAEKEYRAFVYGHPKEAQGVIEAEIVRLRTLPPRWGVKRTGEDKKHRAAITEWEVLARGIDPETKENVSLLAVFPKTGRTHQIRVHLKHIGYPVVSDHLYAPTKPQLLGFTRPALHALRLTLTLPSGEKRTFEAPLSEDFQRALGSSGMASLRAA